VRGSIVASQFFITQAQRRVGLHLSALATTLNTAAAAGHHVTQHHRLGDAAINAANHSHRHAAVLRTTFTKPAKVPGGEWFGTRTKVAVRCAAGTAAVLENRYYSDAKFTKVANERINKMPGYAAPVPGSIQAIAVTALCSPK
jgi:hypothetical protein